MEVAVGHLVEGVAGGDLALLDGYLGGRLDPPVDGQLDVVARHRRGGAEGAQHVPPGVDLDLLHSGGPSQVALVLGLYAAEADLITGLVAVVLELGQLGAGDLADVADDVGRRLAHVAVGTDRDGRGLAAGEEGLVLLDVEDLLGGDVGGHRDGGVGAVLQVVDGGVELLDRAAEEWRQAGHHLGVL